jgi:predicted O-linked N-acetylglucosamine transferase (SPINDLY family)
MAKNNLLLRTKKKRALALFQSDQLKEAKRLYTQLSKSNPRDADAWQMLGAIEWKLENLDQAEIQFAHALNLAPNDPILHFSIGCVLLAKRQKADAEVYLARAIALKPDHVEAHITLGNALATAGRLGDAANYYRKAIQFSPANPVLFSNLGNVLAAQGQTKEAMQSWRHALAIQPDYVSAHSNLLLCLNYNGSHDPETVYNEHLAWAERHERPVHRHALHNNDPDPYRPLNVGYVTADLREHSVAHFFEPILTNHDPDQFKVYCYTDVASPDETTRRLLPLIAHHRSTCTHSNQQIAEQVREDGIDILIDLAGHTSGNRLLVFAHKPAPIQVTYLGYPNTTGMSSIDYRLTDSLSDPPGETDGLHSEKLYRLEGGFLCYMPPADTPPVGPLPLHKHGYVTFGAFNAVAKTNLEVISLWSRILESLPTSRLVLKNKSFSDPATCARYAQLFADRGIDPARIEMIGLTPAKRAHLDVYNRIDIALDTFPYNGTTTTCDTLWMGLPVIALAGTTHAGRVGVSLLSQLGLDECIARTPDDYVAIAIRLAKRPEHLRALRGRLRRDMATSSLCDGEAFTRKLESAYRDMWTSWCNSQTANAPVRSNGQ